MLLVGITVPYKWFIRLIIGIAVLNKCFLRLHFGITVPNRCSMRMLIGFVKFVVGELFKVWEIPNSDLPKPPPARYSCSEKNRYYKFKLEYCVIG